PTSPAQHLGRGEGGVLPVDRVRLGRDDLRRADHARARAGHPLSAGGRNEGGRRRQRAVIDGKGLTARLPPPAAHCRPLPSSSTHTPPPASPTLRRRAWAALAPSPRTAPRTRRRTGAAATDSLAR